MTDARTTQRHPDAPAGDTGPHTAPGTVAPRPTPQYAGLFMEPDLPPLLDEPE